MLTRCHALPLVNCSCSLLFAGVILCKVVAKTELVTMEPLLLGELQS